MPAIPVRPPTMANPRFGTDFGVSVWQPFAPVEPTADERASAARNQVARELLPAIWQSERAGGHDPIGFARMRHPDGSSSSFQRADAGDGSVWVPPFDISNALSLGFELIDTTPDLGPAEMLVAYLERAVEEGRIPAGFTLVRHPDPTATCSVDAFGPSMQRPDGALVVPYAALEALMSHGFRPTG